MAQRKMLGADQVIMIDPAGGTDYKLVICLTEGSFSITNNEIESTTKCGVDTQPGNQKLSLGFNGELMLSPDTPKLGAVSLFQLAHNKTQFGWRKGPAIPVTGDHVIVGKGFFSKYDTTDGSEGAATFSATVGVIGDVTDEEIEVPAAPTAGVVDNTANTFAFTENPLFTLSQHQMSTDGGDSWATATNPVTGLTGAIAIGEVQVRVAPIGINPASAVLSNATAFS